MKTIDRAAVEAALAPLDRWSHDCHRASLTLVKSGALPGSRVARGSCVGVGVNHSWVAVDGDPYAKHARIIDPTLWSYNAAVTGIWYGTEQQGWHTPMQGRGSIWTWGKPVAGEGKPIRLTPSFRLSSDAKMFIDMFGPLDYTGWSILTHAPVHGWPAGEIFAAMDDTEQLAALVPVDLIGMLTDRNPEGLYLPEKA